ncbi:alpha/beta fold hydrolase [Microbacterium sp. CJ88]|uniref:alpha/beta fold hydrolase n=1 Tax=Microbacterium sp. CJ88 TaxID=3445672 RepID=UPI003F65D4BD
MPAPVTLPRLAWGDPLAPRRALLVHGLGSNGPLMWRVGTALADDGWYAVAVDLRGHGTAPRALDYTIAAYAADLAGTRPDDGGAWDAVIGHSLGGVASIVAAADHPDWTRRLVPIDPAVHLVEEDRASVRAGQVRSFDDPSIEAVRAEHPHWHELDVELKTLSTRQASRWAVDQTSVQNPEWDERDAALRLTVPMHVIAADPALGALFAGTVVEELHANPHVTVSVVAGAGHSAHRDDPEETLRQLREALA